MKILFAVLLSCLFVTSIFALTPKEYCATTKTNKCVTPFGTFLGEFDGVKAYFNCRSECVNNLPNQIPAKVGSSENINTGISWQCVEYARRWWVLKLGIVFGSVDTANQIYDLTEAIRIKDGKKISLQHFPNSSHYLPRIGDLLIYKKDLNSSSWIYGHVAVIAGVNVKQGYIDVAEQNYKNQVWEKKNKYARRIAIELKDGVYTIYDIEYSDFEKSTNKSDGKDKVLGVVTVK